MTGKKSFLFLKRKIGEIIEIEIAGKKAQVIIKDIDGKVCMLAFRASRDFVITRGGIDEGIVESTIEKRENRKLQHKLKSNSSLSSLMGAPHIKGTLSFGEYRNRSIKSVPAYYLDHQLTKDNLAEDDRQVLQIEKTRRINVHNKKENL